MHKIGVIVGREWSWPPAFIEEVVKRNEDVVAEYAKLGGTRMDEVSPYAVLVDRISHEVPYYRSYLKNAMLQGSYVVNNTFMWTADDKFFGAALITKLGVASPKTVVLPNKEYVPGIVHNESLRNLTFPVPWESRDWATFQATKGSDATRAKSAAARQRGKRSAARAKTRTMASKRIHVAMARQNQARTNQRKPGLARADDAPATAKSLAPWALAARACVVNVPRSLASAAASAFN